MANHLLRLAGSFAREERSLASLSMLGEAEEAQILAFAKGPLEPAPTTI